MLNKTAKEFRAMLKKLKEDMVVQEAALAVARKMVETAVEAEKETEKEIVGIQNKIEAARRGMLLAKPLDKEILKLRNSIISKKIEAQSNKIRIIDKEKLENETPLLVTKLRDLCSHPFVFHKGGYQGSPLNDYDDGFPAERYCVVCGFDDKASDFRQNGILDCTGSIFKTLKSNEARIVQHEPYRPHPQCLGRVDIWQPLGAVLHPFEEWIAKTLNGDD